MTECHMSAVKWNDKGCEEFKKNNLSEALSYYTKAINVENDNTYKAIYYSNRATVYFKLKDYEKAVEDCDSAFKICYNKVLYRKCQALIALKRFEEADWDAKIIISSDPENIEFQCTAELLQEREKHSAKISKMVDQAFSMYTSEKEREIAMNDLRVLARDENTAEEIIKKKGVSKIVELVKVEKNEKILCSAIYIVGKLCKNNISRTKFVMKSVDWPWFMEIINSTSIERVNASQYCLQNILDTYIDINNKPDTNLKEDLCEAQKEIDTIMLCLSYSITSKSLTGLARDTIIEFIMRNIHCVTKLCWVKQFVEVCGVQRLMEVASEMEEYKNKYKSSMDITSSTQTITRASLTKIFENLYPDDEETFINAINEFITDKLLSPDIESKVRLTVAITALLLSPLDVGNTVVAREEILEMILVMAGTDDVLQQKVALECIVAAVNRKDEVDAIKSVKILNQGVKIFKKLCQSKDNLIRVRALVDFCEMGIANFGNSDATTGPFADGMTKELTEACKRLLNNPEKENNAKEWALKGLAYLTFNSEIQENLIEDEKTIPMMIEIAKTGDKFVLFAVLTTLVNLCNAYDQHEPKIIELTKFIKYYFPEKSELTNDNFVKGLWKIGAADVISVLVNLAKTDSQDCKELIARVFKAICLLEGVRKVVVQQGGTEVLLSLALDGTVEVKKQASLALAYLAHTKHLETIFSEQLLTEFVQPIVNVLNPECSISENYQILKALCNLAKVDDSMREHIFKKEVLQKIKGIKSEEDYLLRLESTKLINALILSREVAIQYFEQDNSRVEYLMSLYKDENQDIKFAAAAALVMLTVANKEACKKVFDSNFGLEFLRSLLTNPSNNKPEMGVIFVLSMMRNVKDVAAELNKTGIMALLRELCNKNGTENNNIKELTSIALEAAAERSRKEAIDVTRWERETACRLEQLDLVHRLEIKLWVYEYPWVQDSVYSEFGRILTN